ncbi:ribose-phosphate diphosphokinase [Salmonella phage SSBI34]|nr:ribose-phosphate diphosphokinase [Salmonella phage SSBI34]
MISLHLDNFKRVKLEFMTFSGGERNVRIGGLVVEKDGVLEFAGYGEVDHLSQRKWENYRVTAHIQSSDDIMDLLLLKDAIDRVGNGCLRRVYSILHLPYLPYARQDRAMVNGESISVVVMANLINSLGFDAVWIDDPHSDVGPSHIKNAVITPQHELLLDMCNKDDVLSDGTIIVAPDAGAMKKASKLAELADLPLGTGGKHRDVKTGKITGTTYSGPDVKGKRCLLVDDIADGAATFVFLAEKLKSLGAKQVDLYVTHGIFSKGIDDLEHIDKIYSAYPWRKNVKWKNEKGKLNTVDIVSWFE